MYFFFLVIKKTKQLETLFNVVYENWLFMHVKIISKVFLKLYRKEKSYYSLACKIVLYHVYSFRMLCLFSS